MSDYKRVSEAMERENKKRPFNLTPIPKYMWPSDRDPKRTEVYISRQYLVQQFNESPGVVRLSVCRTRIKNDGTWEDNISWEELQDIKRQIGMYDKYAIEIYPPDSDVVNVANMRHLWVLDEPINIGWKRNEVTK